MVADILWLPALIAGIFGLLIGSFLNVCIYRLPRDLSVVIPRSFCPECGTAVAWYDNIPVLSFFMLRARCRQCRKPILWRYPIVEIAAGLLFAASLWRFGLTLAAVKWMVFEAMMLVLFWTDLEENILPDEFTLGASVLGLAFAGFVPVHGLFDVFWPGIQPWIASILNALSTGLLFAAAFWGFAKIYQRIRRPESADGDAVQEAMGLGDIKLMICLGVFLGIRGELLTVLIGTISGAIFGVAYVLVRRLDWRTSTLPFGSFLCAGAALTALL